MSGSNSQASKHFAAATLGSGSFAMAAGAKIMYLGGHPKQVIRTFFHAAKKTVLSSLKNNLVERLSLLFIFFFLIHSVEFIF